jgi:uncharacterized protein (TIGR02611 family)
MFMVEVALKTLRQVKRLVIGLIGFTVLVIGVAMIVLPGPAFIVIPVGLGILATEFVWAKSVLHSVKQRIEKTRRSKENPSQA